jgi:Domain of Unknown Function (DUF928)
MNRLFIGTAGAIALVIAYFGKAQALPFAPPTDNSAPRSAVGGASRGGFFTPPADNSAPRRAAGGASRGGFFTPPADNSAPHRAAGGASRGGFFTPPADNSAPRRAAGGASRGNAEASTLALMAIVGLTPQSFYGTTVSEQPTILVYLPDSTAQEVIFSLKDEANRLHYSITAPVSGAGVYAFQIPANAVTLELGKNYHWLAALEFNHELTPGSPYVDGWIKRIEASSQLSGTLAQGDLLKDAAALGAAGVWYDSVAKLASLRNAQPQSEAIAHHWRELLSSVGLQDLSTAPLVAFIPQR